MAGDLHGVIAALNLKWRLPALYVDPGPKMQLEE